MQDGVLVVSTSPGGACCEAVRAFLSPMERRVRSVEAKLTEADGVVFASELWTVDRGELSGVAEEIATWIETESGESGEPKDLEAVIMIRDERSDDER